MPQTRLRLQTTPASYFKIFSYCLLGAKGNPRAPEKVGEKLRAMTGASSGAMVNQGRVGLYAAVKASLQDGKDEVIMSPYTLYEIINMVIYAGAKPVFVDTMKNHPYVELEKIEALKTPKTAAILITHYHMPTPEIADIAIFARDNDIRLIEDCAVSFGGRIKDKWVGQFGDIGVFSFGLFKIINAFYGGGVISENDEFFRDTMSVIKGFEGEHRSRLLKRSVYGLALDVMTHPLVFPWSTYQMIRIGHRSKSDWVTSFTRADMQPDICSKYPSELERTPSTVQAQLVLDRIDMQEKDRLVRETRAKKIYEAFSGMDELILPRFDEDTSGSWTEFPIVCKDRDGLYNHLLDRGRDIRYFYYRNCADLKVYKDYYRDCPNARDLMMQTIMLPLYPRYPESEIDANIDAIVSCYR